MVGPSIALGSVRPVAAKNSLRRQETKGTRDSVEAGSDVSKESIAVYTSKKKMLRPVKGVEYQGIGRPRCSGDQSQLDGVVRSQQTKEAVDSSLQANELIMQMPNGLNERMRGCKEER